MRRNLFLGFGFQPVYGSGDDGGDAAAAAKAAADKAAADKAAADAAAANDPFKRLNFTPEQQDFFNRRMAEEKRAMQTQNQKTIEDLKKLQAQSSTSEQQKKELQTRIEELQRTHMTKEELAKEDQARRDREYNQALTTSKAETEKWKNLFHESTITRALQDGAIEFEAFNPAQIVDILAQKTKLADELDEQNQPTGRMIPRVHYTELDKEGKLVTLDLTVKEALTKMKNAPEKWGNLFKSTLAGGLGQGGSANGGRGRSGGKRPQDMTPAEWAEARKKDPSLSFADQRQ